MNFSILQISTYLTILLSFFLLLFFFLLVVVGVFGHSFVGLKRFACALTNQKLEAILFELG